jgi:general secretion pathway protein C
MLRLGAVPSRYWKNLLIGLFSAWIIITIGFFISDLSGKNSIPGADKNTAKASAATQNTAIDIDAMVNWHLFGEHSGGAVSAPPTATVNTDDGSKDADKTRLPILLVGLMYAQDEKMARAILVINNDERQFLVGETLPLGGNIKLHKVLIDRVIISNNGNLEALWLFDPDRPRIAQPVQESEAPLINTPQQPAEESLERGPLAQSALQIVPAWGNNGKLQGYRINRGANSAAFDAIGFSDGDIVTKINDVQMDNPQNAIQLYQQMQRGGSATFEVIRDGQTISFQAELDQNSLFSPGIAGSAVPDSDGNE